MLQKTFFLISEVIALYAFQQGDEIEIPWKYIKNTKSCGDWGFDPLQNSLNTCRSGANCTFFFFKHTVTAGNEWFGDFQIESRHLENDSFSRFELRILYDNMDEQIIGKLPKTILNSNEFQKSNNTINFSIDKRYENVTLGVWGPNFCGHTLKPIRVYYYQCPSSTRVLVNFKATHAPSKNSSPIFLKGNCTDNAVQSNSSSLSMTCYYNGSYEVFGSCSCKAGFSNLANGRHNNNCKG